MLIKKINTLLTYLKLPIKKYTFINIEILNIYFNYLFLIYNYLIHFSKNIKIKILV